MMGTAQDIPEIGLPPSDLPAGTMVGGYQVTEKIGQGGMGQVYAASHPLIGKKVAIKILAPQCVAVPDLVRRFIEEARAVNKIGHPHIIDIFSFGQLPDGRHFMVMEYLEGKNLAQRLERETIPVPELRRLLVQICEALEAAHGAGIVHRDLKPENIWIVQKPQEESHIKLLDFGIAKLLSADTGRITQTGAAMGTPQFMPPEQCLGRPVDHRADIYSFGIILYLVFTGHLPFNGSTLAEIVYRHTTEAPRPPSEHRPLPAALEKLILDCLAKEPEMRPRSAREVAERLDAVLSGSSRTSTVVLSNEVARGARGRTPERSDSEGPPRWAPPANARSWEQLEQAVSGTTAPAGGRPSRTLAGVLLGIGICTLGAGLVLSRADRPPPGQVEALATAAETRLNEAIASGGRALEPRAAEAARVPQLESALKLGNGATLAEVRGTVRDLLNTEDWWAPFRAPPMVSALLSGDGTLASVGPGLAEVVGSDLVKRARSNGIASGLLPGQDRVFYGAATLVDGNDRGPGAPLVVLGVPLDQAAFQAVADRTGDAIGLAAGTRLLETAGAEQPRRLLGALAQRPGRARPLDDAGAWLGTIVPVDGKLSLLSVFAAPAPPRPLRSGLVVAAIGGLLLVIGAGLLMRSRAR
jgi:serine/threonine protein kinase